MPMFDRRVVSGDYFAAFGIPVIAGRAFRGEDRGESAARVAIVNAAAARAHWSEGNPHGQRVRLMLRSGPGPWPQVVGVVGEGSTLATE